MKIQIGCGKRPLPGFVNVDVQFYEGVDLKGSANHLSKIESETVDFVFLSAVFEHLYVAQQKSALVEWMRVMKPGGKVLVTGIPDFEALARLYLNKAPGLKTTRFDLFNIYQFSHGAPEEFCPSIWQSWRPERKTNQAPKGWLPQLHKSIFDAEYLSALLDSVGLHYQIFRYAFPGDEVKINLGFLAAKSDLGKLNDAFDHVPGIDHIMTRKSVEIVQVQHLGDTLVDYANRHGAQPFPKLSERIVGKIKRVFKQKSLMRR